ncbi:M15 family metallopeptidase [Brevibacterium sp.]|uniref:M15 family metallopeptidase n=1 Tax=Brevibacterium sp. TaxID=1701 RepID=UPI002810D322|nr:M15 family metallopeptidase [Brevibacterium sp.]
MSSDSSTAVAPVRRRDLRKQHASSRVTLTGSQPTATVMSPVPAASNSTTSAQALSPRRAAMAAEARAVAGSPRREAMARQAMTEDGWTGAALAASAGGRGSDGALLRSVRRKRVTSISALATVSVTGTAIAAVMIAGNMGGEQEVKVDTTAADTQTKAINAESVSANIASGDEKTSMAIGAPSATQTKVKAASRAIKKTALPGCNGQAPKSSASNGEVPEEWLCKIGVGDHKLRADAAVAFAKMNAKYKKETGKNLSVTDSYRSLEAQVSVAARKPGFAARPGTSNHGWGIALDLDTSQYDWLEKNAGEFGWENPDWAKRNSYELWHWEYVPGRKDMKGA